MRIEFAAFGTLLIASACHGQVVPQRSQFKVELSQNGTDWFSHLDIFTQSNPVVFARVLVSYFANGGQNPLFLRSGRFQPVGSGWEPGSGDTVLPYDPDTRIEADYSTADGDGLSLGRVFGSTTISPITTYQYSFGGQNYLRFAEANVPNHPGEGSGSNNVTGTRGILVGNNILTPQLGLTDVVLFTWGMSFASDRLGIIDFTIPQEGIRSSSATAIPPSTRSVAWATSATPFTEIEAPTLETLGATLTVNVPSPGAVALLSLGGLWAGRRRR